MRPRPGRRILSRLFLFGMTSALCGVLVAGLVLPVAGVVGLAARTGAESFEGLPADLETPPLPQRSRILDADGRVLAQFYYENRISVPLSKVAPVMRKAMVAIEDSRFYLHGGGRPAGNVAGVREQPER
jgi:membrane carboxypeptidase/penicillin-binding protein